MTDTAVQRRIAIYFLYHADAVKSSNINNLILLYHDNFIAWNYDDPKPVEQDEFLNGVRINERRN